MEKFLIKEGEIKEEKKNTTRAHKLWRVIIINVIIIILQSFVRGPLEWKWGPFLYNVFPPLTINAKYWKLGKEIALEQDKRFKNEGIIIISLFLYLFILKKHHSKV